MKEIHVIQVRSESGGSIEKGFLCMLPCIVDGNVIANYRSTKFVREAIRFKTFEETKAIIEDFYTARIYASLIFTVRYYFVKE